MKAKLENMFAIPLSKLVADTPIPFPLYLLLKRNDRLVPIRMPGDAIGEQMYKEFLEKQHAELWVPSDFQTKYIEYLDKIEGKVETLAEVAAQPAIAANNTAESAIVAPVTLEAPDEIQLVKEILEDTGMSASEKSDVLSAIGQDILRSLSQISQRGEEPRRQGLRRCKQLADEILELACQHKSIYDEILALRSSQEDLEHSTMVGTIAVMFSLAIGQSDKDALADITLAGLFHDIGLVKINPQILLKAENTWQGAERQEYEGHIMAGITLLKESSKEFNPIVFRMIEEHHENFDGSGFPARLKGEQIAEASQILHLANLFDHLCTGKFDGVELSPQEAFARIAKIATNPSAIQEVNPVLVSKIFQFILNDAGSVMEIQKEMQDRSARTAAEAFNP